MATCEESTQDYFAAHFIDSFGSELDSLMVRLLRHLLPCGGELCRSYTFIGAVSSLLHVHRRVPQPPVRP